MLPLLMFVSTLLAITVPDWSYYHSADKIHARMNDMAARHADLDAFITEEWAHLPSESPATPSDILVTTIGNHRTNPLSPLDMELAEGPAANLLRTILDPQTLKTFSSDPTSPYQSPPAPPMHILLNFGEHGRELISSEIALKLMEYIDLQKAVHADRATVEEAATNAFSTYVDPLFLSYLFSHTHWKVVPLLNVWSHRRVEQGNMCERKNQGGVDLNRNWDYLWNGYGDPNPDTQTIQAVAARARLSHPSSEQYPGPRAFSERESRVLKHVAETWKPMMYVNYHSGIKEMYCGWDYQGLLIPTHLEPLRVLQHINRKYCKCSVGGAGIIGGYVVYGGSMDYLYDKLKCPYSITVEVFGGPRNGISPADCFAYFNPTHKTELDSTTNEWARSTVEAVYYVVKEKRGVAFPYGLPKFLQDDSVKPMLLASPVKPDTDLLRYSNHYSRWSQLAAKLIPNGNTDSSSTLLHKTFQLYHSSRRNTLSFTVNGMQKPVWNSPCTPFFLALPKKTTSRWNTTVFNKPHVQTQLDMIAQTWSMSSASDALIWNSTDAQINNGQKPPLKVLIVGGGIWNDMFTTELICNWMKTISDVQSNSDAHISGSSSVKFFFIPSLFSSYRTEIMESPLLHTSFCSAQLNANQKVTLLSYQLATTQKLFQLIREEIRPSLVVEVTAEEAPRATPEEIAAALANQKKRPAAFSSSGAPLKQPHLTSVLHVEYINLHRAPEAAKSTLKDVFLTSLKSMFSTAAATNDNPTSTDSATSTLFGSTTDLSKPTEVSWSNKQRMQAVSELYGDDEAVGGNAYEKNHCIVGHIDLPRLLIPTKLDPHSALCPSCFGFVRIYAHGRKLPFELNIKVASAQFTEYMDKLHELEEAERSWLLQHITEYKLRSGTDLIGPASYIHAEVNFIANPTPKQRLGKGEWKLSVFNPENVHIPGADSGPFSASTIHPAPAFGCDFLRWNLPAHETSQFILARHFRAMETLLPKIISRDNMERIAKALGEEEVHSMRQHAIESTQLKEEVVLAEKSKPSSNAAPASSPNPSSELQNPSPAAVATDDSSETQQAPEVQITDADSIRTQRMLIRQHQSLEGEGDLDLPLLNVGFIMLLGVGLVLSFLYCSRRRKLYSAHQKMNWSKV